MTTKKFCTKCGHEFVAIGREVICPACKARAAEESKKAAVLRAKRASWSGESVPVRISGRASTVIRAYGKVNSLPFAQALDALLKSTDYFKSTGVKWEDVTPYKSRRMKKSIETAQEAPQDAQEVKQAAKTASKTVKTTAKKAAKTVKTATGKAAGKKEAKTASNK